MDSSGNPPRKVLKHQQHQQHNSNTGNNNSNTGNNNSNTGTNNSNSNNSTSGPSNGFMNNGTGALTNGNVNHEEEDEDEEFFDAEDEEEDEGAVLPGGLGLHRVDRIWDMRAFERRESLPNGIHTPNGTVTTPSEDEDEDEDEDVLESVEGPMALEQEEHQHHPRLPNGDEVDEEEVVDVVGNGAADLPNGVNHD
ncbi:hypothetical protein ABEF95_004630 [Exophiala dermatitidis]